MKKLLNKIPRRKRNSESPSRITTETIAEHREQVLAGGRRFKYPIQYARHKLVINTIIISVVTLALLVLTGWWQLYKAQNTGDFMYRVTRVLPLPVASVDGFSVRFSDYLMKYRSSIHYLVEKEQVNLKTEQGQQQSEFVKSQALHDAIADAFAAKLAKERGIVVSDEELEAFLKAQRYSADGEVSQATYDAVTLDYYGWSPDEYRQAMRAKLLRQKVSYAIDDVATGRAEVLSQRVVAGNTDLKALSDALNQTDASAYTFVDAGWVPRTNQDGGLARAAASLEKGQVSAAVSSTTGDGYYFIKLIDKTDTQVNYQYVRIGLSAFSRQFDEVLASGNVHRFIDVALPNEGS